KERADERRNPPGSSLTPSGVPDKRDGGPRAPAVLILPGERLRRWNWNLLSRDRDHISALDEGALTKSNGASTSASQLRSSHGANEPGSGQSAFARSEPSGQGCTRGALWLPP